MDQLDFKIFHSMSNIVLKFEYNYDDVDYRIIDGLRRVERIECVDKNNSCLNPPGFLYDTRRL
jgi:hypothetical protein